MHHFILFFLLLDNKHNKLLENILWVWATNFILFSDREGWSCIHVLAISVTQVIRSETNCFVHKLSHNAITYNCHLAMYGHFFQSSQVVEKLKMWYKVLLWVNISNVIRYDFANSQFYIYRFIPKIAFYGCFWYYFKHFWFNI